ncbi:MAG: esterase/lipase family protein [Acutalibacteraceae bacterium]
MKKLLAVLLSLAITVSCCAFAASASGEVKGEITDYPVIIVPGYSSASLYYGDSLETGEHVWGIDMDLITQRLLANIAQIGIGLGAMTLGNAEYIAKVVGEEFAVMFEKMRCNPDGSSAYELKRDYTDGADTNNAVLMERYPDGQYRHEKDIAAEIAEYIGDAKIYNFSSDFRMGSEICAAQLDEYIQTVKRHSGKDKVNLFAVSHGGQVTATYLNLYGWKGDVDNAVMTIPAIGGAGIAYDIGMGKIALDEECLLRFIEHGMRWEEDYDWLVKAQQLGFLDKVFNALVPYFFSVMGYWGSIWDFMPTDKYEQAKAKLLDSEASAELIRKSDRFHYEILPAMGEKFAECIENGMNISIIAGTGNDVVTGLQVNSDGIIPTECATGATCAPLGKRFADGYIQKNPCGGKNKLSPAMDIDASTAYMPDNTWFVDGLFHGMTYWDDYTRVLMMNLLLTDNITDVYSNSDYPQFRYTSNPSSAVYAQFSGCQPGILSGEATSLTVRNICKESRVRIAAVCCDGIELDFRVSPNRVLQPGESIEIPFTGDIPAVSGKAVGITVYYYTNTVTPVGYRTQSYTVENGERVAAQGMFANSAFTAPIDKIIGKNADALLKNLGLKEFVSMVTTIVYYWINTVFAAVK